jgi:hypothetical protein
MIASPAGAAADGQSVTCPSCGHQNLPGDAFCDNCGAALAAPAATPAATDPTLIQAPQSAPAAPTAAPATAGAALAEQPTAEQQPVAGAAVDAQAAYEAERKRLEDEIGRQQKIIEQFEQMQQMFGAATPPAVSQGLAEARDAKARVEAELAALQPPAPPIDPAEVQRLEDEIGRQQKIIEQFEQMQQMFGAAAPAAVTQGLAEARDAKARVEAELANLRGGAAAAAPAAPAAPSEAQAKAAQAEAQLGQVGTVPAPAAVVPPAPAPTPPTAISEPAPEAVPPPMPAASPAPSASAAPRLVMDDGRELSLPTDKREIIVGREDPISGIFPEVDLTPYGGETGGVSRQHARISRSDGQWTITDLNSTNYTRVDGARIEPSQPVAIKSGARLQFGRVAMTFHE